MIRTWLEDFFHKAGRGVLRLRENRGLALSPWDALPTAAAHFRSLLLPTWGGAGTADTLRFVRKNAADAYEVVTLAHSGSGGGTFADNVFTLQDNGDATKQMQFDLAAIPTGTTRTLQTPSVSGELLLVAATQSVQNKTLDTTNTLLVKASLTNFTNNAASLATTLAAEGLTANRVLTIPDATTTIVGTTATQTLTNKTLTAPTIADFTNMAHDHLDADDGGTLTAAAVSDFNEAVDDRVGALVVAGNNIDVTYNDGAGTLTIDVEALTSADLTDFATAVDERARDAVGTALVAGNNIDITVDDGADTITVAVETLTIDDLTDVGGITAILTGSTTWNPANIAGGGRDSTPVTVTGAAVGDVALCGFTTNTGDVLGCIATVTATDTCTAVLHNLTTGTASDLGSGTVRCTVVKY